MRTKLSYVSLLRVFSRINLVRISQRHYLPLPLKPITLKPRLSEHYWLDRLSLHPYFKRQVPTCALSTPRACFAHFFPPVVRNTSSFWKMDCAWQARWVCGSWGLLVWPDLACLFYITFCDELAEKSHTLYRDLDFYPTTLDLMTYLQNKVCSVQIHSVVSSVVLALLANLSSALVLHNYVDEYSTPGKL